MKTKILLGQPSWPLGSDCVKLAVTQLGGFLGPVEFSVGRKTISPYSIPPWAGKPDAPAGALGALRGDVFCVPFGGNQRPYRGERHPPHGDPFHAKWRFVSHRQNGATRQLTLDTRLRTRAGHVRKEVILRDGETVVYQRHTISGLLGRMSFGYHATLDFSRFGSGRISTSRILFGKTQAADFERAAQGGYCSLRPDTIFRRLDRVPRRDGTFADLTTYPTEGGYENLVLLANDPRSELAWTAATFARDGWVWFSLKLARELTCTLLWLSNGGRHYAPWNGRHRARLGLEEVTSLPEGLAEAAALNDFSRRGISVCREFRKSDHCLVRSATGICPVPRDFDRVKSIRLKAEKIHLVAYSGATAVTTFDPDFFETPDVERIRDK